jgi:DJ-1/PfpI family
LRTAPSHPRFASYKSIKTDVINAGGKWEDSQVVVDKGVITSRNPGDLEAFSAKIIEEIVEGNTPSAARLKATGLSCYRKRDAPERRGPAPVGLFFAAVATEILQTAILCIVIDSGADTPS